MDKFKQQIQRQLFANIMKDKCSNSEHLIFRDAWCTQERVIRFATLFFREQLGVLPEGAGKWKTGDHVIYEVNNGMDNLTVQCVLSFSALPKEKRAAADSLAMFCSLSPVKATDDIVLKSWNLTRADGDVNQMMEAFDRLISKEIPLFEQNLREKAEAARWPQALTEGEADSVTSNRYERNPKARAACLAYHGTACAVCGMDFGKTYGPAFAGKIEVHHIVPLSEIGEEYVVDPVKDLIPVCPNCHTALHSKKDGVYTVSELRALRNKQE